MFYVFILIVLMNFPKFPKLTPLLCVQNHHHLMCRKLFECGEAPIYPILQFSLSTVTGFSVHGRWPIVFLVGMSVYNYTVKLAESEIHKLFFVINFRMWLVLYFLSLVN